MATVVLTDTQRFPEGTVVGAYLWPTYPMMPAAIAQLGDAVDTSTMTAGELQFDGLPDYTRFLAYAVVGGVDTFVRFSTPLPAGGGGDVTQEELDDEAATRAAADIALQDNLTAEYGVRGTSDAGLAADIGAEATARANADIALAAAMATDAELAAGLATKQDAATAATDAELTAGLALKLTKSTDPADAGKAADARDGAPIDLTGLGGGITLDDVDRRLVGKVGPILVNGHSGAFGGGATLLDNSWAEILAGFLQVRAKNRALGGAVGCWPNSGTAGPIGLTGDGGYATALQTIDTKRKVAPYKQQPGLPIVWWVQNDLAALGHSNLRPALESVRTVVNLQRASASFGIGDFGYAGTFVTAANVKRNSGASTKLTATSGDTTTLAIPADFDGRDIVVYLAVDSTFVGSVAFAIPGEPAIAAFPIASNGAGGNTVCQPQAEVADKHNVVCRRFAAAASCAGKTLTVTFTHTSGGSVGVDRVTFQANKPVLVPGCWKPSDNYTEWATWTHGPAAGSDPMNDAAVDSANAQVTAMCAEWADGLVVFVPVDDLFNEDPAAFVIDHTHPNDASQPLIAVRIYEAIRDLPVDWADAQLLGGSGSQDLDAIYYSGLDANVYIGRKLWSDSTPGVLVHASPLIRPLAPSLVGAVIQGLVGQSTALTQWQDSSSNVLATVNQNGQANFNAVSAGTAATVPIAQLGVASTSSVIVALGVRGAASQTANLTEWQSSAGTVLANVTAAGQANFLALSVGAPATVPVAQLAVASQLATTVALGIRGAASQSGNLTEWQSSAAAVLANVTAAGQANFGAISAGVPANVPVAQLSVVSTLATTVALAAKGAASQSASLFEAQNSSNSVLAKVDSAGNVIASVGAATQVAIGNGFGAAAVSFGSASDALILRTAAGELTTNRFIAGSAVTTTVPLVGKGAASQTADILSVVNSSSTQLFGITAAGLPRFAVAGNAQITIGANGAAAALTALPKGYFKALDSAGANVVIPYYNA